MGSTFTWDPYGQPLVGFPSDTSAQLSHGWEGAKEKPYEHQGDISTVEMGARQYIAALGRFLSFDPKDGGCANAYTFGFGDPENHPDTSGQFLGGLLCDIRHSVVGSIGAAVGAAAVIAGALNWPDEAFALGTLAIGFSAVDAVQAAIKGDTKTVALDLIGIGLGGVGVGFGKAAKAITSTAGRVSQLFGTFSFLTGVGILAHNPSC